MRFTVHYVGCQAGSVVEHATLVLRAVSSSPMYLKIKIFLKKLFIHERHRERQRHRQREKQTPHREPDEGPDPRTPGSHPEPKADAQPRSHPGAPPYLLLEPPRAFCIGQNTFGCK